MLLLMVRWLRVKQPLIFYLLSCLCPLRMGQDGNEIYFSWFIRKSCYLYASQ